MPYAKVRPIVITYLFLILSINCQNNTWGKFWDLHTSAVTVASDPLAACKAAVAGDERAIICVPANTTGFSRGYTGLATPIHTVASISPFAMGKYEVTYADWLVVKSWASPGNGYTFANIGQPGSVGGNPDTHPATNMNWRDMIIWCNAASQKSGLTPVYYTDAAFTLPLKVATGSAVSGATTTAGAEDNPYIKWSANGYRLPTGAEYEYAARYVDGTNYTRGDAPSGWVDSNVNITVDQTEKNVVSWDGVNSPGASHPVGILAPNALGIYDLSGNAFELSGDWNGAYAAISPYTDADSAGPATGGSRDARGGGYTGEFGTSARGTTTPQSPATDRGFRVVRRP